MLDNFIQFYSTLYGQVTIAVIWFSLLVVVPFIVAEIRDHIAIPAPLFFAYPVFVFVFNAMLMFTKEGNGIKDAVIGGAAATVLILIVNSAIIGSVSHFEKNN